MSDDCTQRADRRVRVRTYAIWASAVGVAFFAVYPALNWFTSLRSSPLQLYAAAELELPFVPQLIWAYLSMYVLFAAPPFFLSAEQLPALGKQLIVGTLISGVVFLLLPAELGFARSVPMDPPYGGIFAAIFAVDHPHNMVPSLHVVFSAGIILACADVARPVPKILLWSWLVVISLSTVLVHQHHVLDVIAAFAVVAWVRRRYGVIHA